MAGDSHVFGQCKKIVIKNMIFPEGTYDFQVDCQKDFTGIWEHPFNYVR